MDKDRELELQEEVNAVARRWSSAPEDAEAWYRRAVEFYRYDLERAAGKPIPEFHISSGFTNAGQRTTRVAGECWTNAASADKLSQIFLNPRYVDPLQLVNTVVHEVIHAIDNCEHGHFRQFSRVAAACGMRRPWKATRWTEEGQRKAELVVAALGPFPRAAFVGKKFGPGSRLLKAVCPKCGYTIRVTRMWADQGLPYCGGACEMSAFHAGNVRLELVL